MKIGQKEVMLRTIEHDAIVLQFKGDDYVERVPAFVAAIQSGNWQEYGTGIKAGDIQILFKDLKRFAAIRDRFVGRISSGEYMFCVRQWETMEEGS